MKKVSEYKVVCASTTPAFEEKVKEAISEGWQPLGGVSTLQMNMPVGGGNTAISLHLSQAMVKYEQ